MHHLRSTQKPNFSQIQSVDLELVVGSPHSLVGVQGDLYLYFILLFKENCVIFLTKWGVKVVPLSSLT
jgi:hypothetical protein